MCPCTKKTKCSYHKEKEEKERKFQAWLKELAERTKVPYGKLQNLCKER